MRRNIIGWLTALGLLLECAAPAGAQGELAQRIYGSIKDSIRAEYERLLAGLPSEGSEEMMARVEKTRQLMKLFAYNKAALFANCAADAERDRSPQADRLPSAMNLVLRTCVEIKIGQLQKFTERVAYADLFFPDRVEPCGERARLPDQEKILQPYEFLFLDQPRLYDFERYNQCLMSP